MKTVCFAFDDLDFVIPPFKLAGMDRIVAVINDSVMVVLQLTVIVLQIKFVDGFNHFKERGV